MDAPFGYWTVPEASAAWGCHVGTIYHRIKRGNLKCLKRDGHYYIPEGTRSPLKFYRKRNNSKKLLYGLSVRVSGDIYHQIVDLVVSERKAESISAFVEEAIREKLKEEKYA